MESKLRHLLDHEPKGRQGASGQTADDRCQGLVNLLRLSMLLDQISHSWQHCSNAAKQRVLDKKDSHAAPHA
jgi:hypothetical protein